MKVVHTYVPLSPSFITWYGPSGGDALQLVTAGLAESNGSLLPDGYLIVTCRLTVGTPGSSPGPTLSNEYGKPLPLPRFTWKWLCNLCVCLYVLGLAVCYQLRPQVVDR